MDNRMCWEFCDQRLSGWVTCLCAAAETLDQIVRIPPPPAHRRSMEVLLSLAETFEYPPPDPPQSQACDPDLPGHPFASFDRYLQERRWRIGEELHPSYQLHRFRDRSLARRESVVEIGAELARRIEAAARSLTQDFGSVPSERLVACANDLFWEGIYAAYAPAFATASRRLVIAVQYHRATEIVAAGRHRLRPYRGNTRPCAN